jgi:hypothetical protein
MGTTHGYKSVPLPYPCGYGTRGYSYPWVKLPSLLLLQLANNVFVQADNHIYIHIEKLQIYYVYTGRLYSH